jgi:hypothetical protein
MLHKLKARIPLLAGALIFAVGFQLALVNHASAYDCNDYCYDYCSYSGSNTDCLNAWSGGPWIYNYSNPYAQPTSQFNIYSTGSGSNAEIMYLGGTAYQNECAGDAYNSSTDANTSLDNCPTSGGSAGWGTNFQVYNCVSGSNSGYEFYNNHWQAYLGPYTYGTNGQPYYLNNKNPTCFVPVQQIHS